MAALTAAGHDLRVTLEMALTWPASPDGVRRTADRLGLTEVARVASDLPPGLFEHADELVVALERCGLGAGLPVSAAGETLAPA